MMEADCAANAPRTGAEAEKEREKCGKKTGRSSHDFGKRLHLSRCHLIGNRKAV